MAKIARAIKKRRLVKKRKKMQKLVKSSLHKRNFFEKIFRIFSAASVSISLIFLVIMLVKIIGSGYSAFVTTKIKIPVEFSAEFFQDSTDYEKSDYKSIMYNSINSLFPEVTNFREKGLMYKMFSGSAPYEIKEYVINNPKIIGTREDIWLTASSDIDMFFKGKKDHLNSKQIKWIEVLKQQNLISRKFNSAFFTSGDSRSPENAGILSSFIGSVFVIISCMLAAFPIGVSTAVYLEEFAPKNRLTEIIEVNINNLAAVPSIVFGLLGLALYIQLLGIPRSAPIAGGLTLAMMALPIIVIATRTSIKAIPQSIRDGAMALGASKVQTTFHHVVPLAMPGIMTGFILSIARVMGETAPLLMIGMVAFVVDIPHNFLEASTALPAQIYIWSDQPEAGYVEKTSAAIIILLLFLTTANLVATLIRKKFEIKW